MWKKLQTRRKTFDIQKSLKQTELSFLDYLKLCIYS